MKIAFTVLMNERGEQVKFQIPDELVKYPEKPEEGELLFFPTEDEVGDFHFLFAGDVNYIESTDPNDPQSMVVFHSTHGNRWPVHTEKAVLKMGQVMGKMVLLEGGKH